MSAQLQFDLATMRSPKARLGTLVATTSVNNHSTAVAFNNTGVGLAGKLLLLQPDADCWIEFGTANTVTASISATSASFFIAAGDSKIVLMDDAVTSTTYHGWIACVSVSGTTNLKVWELRQA